MKKRKFKPLELVEKVTGRPYEYIDATEARDFLEEYQDLNRAIGLFSCADIGDCYEGADKDTLLLLSQVLYGINRRFEEILANPCSVQVGGQRAIKAMRGNAAYRRAKFKVVGGEKPPSPPEQEPAS